MLSTSVTDFGELTWKGNTPNECRVADKQSLLINVRDGLNKKMLLSSRKTLNNTADKLFSESEKYLLVGANLLNVS